MLAYLLFRDLICELADAHKPANKLETPVFSESLQPLFFSILFAESA